MSDFPLLEPLPGEERQSKTEGGKNEPTIEELESHSQFPRSRSQTALAKQINTNRTTKNKIDFVQINLDSMSGIAIADLKRNAMSSSAILSIEVAKAKDLLHKSGHPSPLCLLAIRKEGCKGFGKKLDLKKEQHIITTVRERNANPVWNERKELKLDQVGGDIPRYLVVEVRTKSAKGDCLGVVEINVNNLADIVQREEWFPLRKRGKPKVTGEILLRTKVRPEKNIPDTIILKNEDFPTIPSFIYTSFWHQHCVKHISITNCNLTSIPEGFYSLSSLETLQLQNNLLTTLPPTIGRIFTLKMLDISNNRVRTLPEEMSNLRNLQLLNIENNNFQDIPLALFDLDEWCEVNGKLPGWNEQIAAELLLRKSEKNSEKNVRSSVLLDEKEKLIQQLLKGLK